MTEELLPLPPGVGGDVIRFEGKGDEREESDMLRLPPPPPLPLPSPDDFDPFGVLGACLFELDDGDEGGGVPDLLALASKAAFWLLRPNGDMAAADGRFDAGEGILAVAGARLSVVLRPDGWVR